MWRAEVGEERDRLKGGESGDAADGPARAVGHVGHENGKLETDQDHAVGDGEAEESEEDLAKGYADVDLVRVVRLRGDGASEKPRTSGQIEFGQMPL